MSEAWDVAIMSPARRDLARLPAKVADAALRFIDGPLRANPQRVTKPLEWELRGLRSGRVGAAHRVLVRVDESTMTVRVYRIAHRADAYRPSSPLK
jgi:mRNA-degrading endonuclease RelE of RelBE toxin-antitoxin system